MDSPARRLAFRLSPVATLDVSAASGLVLHEGLLYVIADDSSALHRYTPEGRSLGSIPLLDPEEALPEEAKARKKVKPDLEALAVLPDGSLLALGSGSRSNRMRGFRIQPGSGQLEKLDLRSLYGKLQDRFPALNIEGAVVRGDTLILLQRGNAEAGENALILLDLATVTASLQHMAIMDDAIRSIRGFEIGTIGGIPLSCTDLAVHPDGTIYFTAAAEDTRHPYDDGACAGSVIGTFDRKLALDWTAHISPDLKIEGLCFYDAVGSGDDRWLLVADADSADVAAPLLELIVSYGQKVR